MKNALKVIFYILLALAAVAGAVAAFLYFFQKKEAVVDATLDDLDELHEEVVEEAAPVEPSKKRRYRRSYISINRNVA